MGLSTTPFSITFRAILLVGSIFLVLLNTISINRIILNLGYIFLIGFYSIYVIRLIFDLSVINIEFSHKLNSKLHIYLFAIGGTFIPILALLDNFKNLSIKTIERTIFWIVLTHCISIVVIFFFLYGLKLEAFLSRHIVANAMQESEIGRPINPIIISRGGGFLALAALFYQSKNLLLKFVRMPSFFLGIGLLLLGASRGPLIAFMLTLLLMGFYFVFFSKKNSMWMVKLIIGFILLLSTFIYIIRNIKNFNISIVHRFTNMANTSNGLQGEERLFQWVAAWNQFLSSPIYGDSFVENFSKTYPHNLLLEILMSTGLIGFILFILTLFFAFKKGFYLLKNGHKLIFCLFFFGFISMLFSGAIFLSPEFWAILVLILGTSNLKTGQIGA